MLSKTRRIVARVAVAGALIAVPLGALAVTASAAEPDASAQSVSDQIPLQGIEIDRHHHHHDQHLGDGGDDQGPWFPGPGNGLPGPAPQPFQPPATGSAG
ncbi:hypothetical protein [Nocardia anaemiae]|uniref:hypothetical protein n=1 Tax=Nocardia anaemiae TaxID=263910 RepID=UPI000A031835|nr:hypothetical protein [Nocardia anaemiae]